MSMTDQQAIKYCRKEARENGLTFKVQPNLKINNGNAYMFIDRKTKERVLENCTLGSAYNNVCSGYIASYNKDKRLFEV